ncbi:MAG: adenylyl-sulfate kinase, partial [Verrucomicrobiota bacterium]
MSDKTKNLCWHPSLTGDKERLELLGQRGCVIWLTGLSGSGKSTIAHALEKCLLEEKHFAFVL